MRMGRCAPELVVHMSVKPPALRVASSRIWLSPRQEVISRVSVRRKATVTTGSRSRLTRRRTVVGVRRVDAHLAERGGGATPVRAAVVDGAVHQVEHLAAERLGVLPVARQLGAGLAGGGTGRLLGAARRQQDQREHGSGGSPSHQSIANSRLNTTSKLKVLARLRVSMISAIRFSLAGMPMIFSWAMRPISLSPCRLSIFQ